jgi:Fe-S-cluster containining protein
MSKQENDTKILADALTGDAEKILVILKKKGVNCTIHGVRKIMYGEIRKSPLKLEVEKAALELFESRGQFEHEEQTKLYLEKKAAYLERVNRVKEATETD